MSIDLLPNTQVCLLATAQAEGMSIYTLLERLIDDVRNWSQPSSEPTLILRHSGKKRFETKSSGDSKSLNTVKLWTAIRLLPDSWATLMKWNASDELDESLRFNDWSPRRPRQIRDYLLKEAGFRPARHVVSSIVTARQALVRAPGQGHRHEGP
jgi:hypothetical protein